MINILMWQNKLKDTVKTTLKWHERKKQNLDFSLIENPHGDHYTAMIQSTSKEKKWRRKSPNSGVLGGVWVVCVCVCVSIWFPWENGTICVDFNETFWICCGCHLQCAQTMSLPCHSRVCTVGSQCIGIGADGLVSTVNVHSTYN